MRIVFDHQIFSSQKFGGISRYFNEIILRIGSTTGNRCILPFPFSNNEYLSGNPAFSGVRYLPGTRFKGKNRSLYLINRYAAALQLLSGRQDIFHPTFFDPFFLPLLRGIPFVLTIHDMIHEIYPEQFSPNDPTSARKHLLAKKAKRLIAVSETTKRDIVRFYGVPDNRIKVIYHGDSLGSEASEAPHERPFPKYFLFVGKRQGYKNFAAMIAAMVPLFREDPFLNLIFTGNDRPTPEELFLLDALGGKARYAWMNVSDTRLISLYRGALALVFPSLYEGFGIPILEAFRCGCPVLLSKASCFPEIAGDAALYFDPASPSDFEAKLRLMERDSVLRNALVEKGRARLAGYSWNRAAEETFQVYREALGG